MCTSRSSWLGRWCTARRLSLADDSPDTARDVSAAKVAASDAALLAARSALQTHGAIGFTQEHDLSLWLLRVQALRSAWGDRDGASTPALGGVVMTKNGELLRETVAALVDKHASPAAVREAMASERGYDESLWKLLCEQVGAAALVVPEELGGAGGELADAAVVLEELGKALVPTPLLGTTLAELALLAAGRQSPTPRRWSGWPRAPRSGRWCSTPAMWSTATSPTSCRRRRRRR